MDILALDKELRAGKIRPAYLILGEEHFLARTAREQILQTVLGDARAAPDVYDAQKTAIGTLLDAYRTPSLLSPQRVLLVTSIEKWKKEEWETLAGVLQNPTPQACLILAGGSVKSPYLKKLPASAGVIECKKLYPRQAAGWLNMEARRLGTPLSEETAQFLIECVGTELGTLRQSLEQLKLFVGKKRLIQIEDVEAVAAKSAQRSVFDLAQAVGERRPERSIRLLRRMEEQGEEPLHLLALIARHLRLLARTQDIIGNAGGRLPPDFAKQIGVHPFFAKEYPTQARRWPAGGWRDVFRALRRCDWRLKSSRNKPYAVMEKLVWEISEGR